MRHRRGCGASIHRVRKNVTITVFADRVEAPSCEPAIGLISPLELTQRIFGCDLVDFNRSAVSRIDRLHCPHPKIISRGSHEEPAVVELLKAKISRASLR